MSAMSASPPVKPVMMPLSLIAEPKSVAPPPGPQPLSASSLPREKQSTVSGSKAPSVPPAPLQPTANGMESSPPQQHHNDQSPPTAAPPPATVAPVTTPPAITTPPVASSLVQPPQGPPLHNSIIQLQPDPLPIIQQSQEGSKCEGGSVTTSLVVTEGSKGSTTSGEESMSSQSETGSGGGNTAEKEESSEGAGVSTTESGQPSSLSGSTVSTPPPNQPPAAPTTQPPDPPPTVTSSSSLTKQSDIKLATLPQPRLPKRKQNKVVSENKKEKEPETEGLKGADGRKSKRVRLRTQPYQSPIPELNLIAKMSKRDKTPTKQLDEKLIVFYRNEFLAVRNAEGGFYICQAMQNIYKSSARIRIRWLSQQDGDLYTPDFYDVTDFDCILTNLNLERVEKNKFRLPSEESQRTQSILKRAIDVEKGVADNTTPTEEHPDGLDLSLYRNEDQLKKRRKSKPKSPKRNSTKSSRLSGKKPTVPGTTTSEVMENSTPVSETRKAKKRGGSVLAGSVSTSSRAARKRKLSNKKALLPNSKKQLGAQSKSVVGSVGNSGSSASKRGSTEVKTATKRKASASSGASGASTPASVENSASASASKRPRRAQSSAQDTNNTKTRSVAVVGVAVAGAKSKLRASSRK